MTRKVSVDRFGEELSSIFSGHKMVVFLCGPSLKDLSVEGAQLRSDLKMALEDEGFEVVLGEDDGLEDLRSKYGHYAHENELQFIQGQCSAVVLIASSPGALCELGLFSYKKAHTDDNKTDFILILDEQFRGKRSYINEGPVTAIDDFGKVFHGDLARFDYSQIIKRLVRRRAVFFTDTRGRPPSKGL
ncbi:MAG: hypothetical protein ABFS24_08805 [Pseudomonadota bacterium]